MVTKGQIFGRMAVGYQPTCSTKNGLWPCYPIMPQYSLPHASALSGLGRPRYPLRPVFALTGLGRANTMPAYGLGALGLFDTFDPTTWGFGEWAILGIGAYALFSIAFTTKKAATTGRLKASATLGQRRRKRATKLREKAKRLESGRGRVESLLFGSET